MNTVVLITGKAGSGKSTVSSFLIDGFEKRNVKTQQFSLAKPLKDTLQVLFGVVKEGTKHSIPTKDYDVLYNYFLDIAYKETSLIIDEYKTDPIRKELESRVHRIVSMICAYSLNESDKHRQILARLLLQEWGTEIGRYLSYSRIWIDKINKNMKDFFELNPNSVALCDDVRFINEWEGIANAFSDQKVKLIHIFRDQSLQYLHASETEICEIAKMADIKLDNNISYDALRSKSDEIVWEVLNY